MLWTMHTRKIYTLSSTSQNSTRQTETNTQGLPANVLVALTANVEALTQHIARTKSQHTGKQLNHHRGGDLGLQKRHCTEQMSELDAATNNFDTTLKQQNRRMRLETRI